MDECTYTINYTYICIYITNTDAYTYAITYLQTEVSVIKI